MCLGGKRTCWCPALPLCSPINPDLMGPEEFDLSPWPGGGSRGGGKLLGELENICIMVAKVISMLSGSLRVPALPQVET